jgi:translation initiation factor IF-3
VNERIRAREVRLVDAEGKQLGVMPARDALEMARNRGLDLIEVAPLARPPVCRIMDYGKYKYLQGKRSRDARKKRAGEVKGIRMRPLIDEHDLAFKLKHAIRFLQEGNKVKFTVNFRGRDRSHPEFARRTLERVAEQTAELATVEKMPSFEGRSMTMILTPRPVSESRQKRPPKPKPKPAESPPSEPKPAEPPPPAPEEDSEDDLEDDET